MANPTPTSTSFRHVGPQCLTVECQFSAGATNTISNAALQGAVPALAAGGDTTKTLAQLTLAQSKALSDLLTFLQSTFASAQAAEEAFADLGGELSIRQFAGNQPLTAPLFAWAAAGPSTPSLIASVAGNWDGTEFVVIQISLRHSIQY